MGHKTRDGEQDELAWEEVGSLGERGREGRRMGRREGRWEEEEEEGGVRVRGNHGVLHKKRKEEEGGKKGKGGGGEKGGRGNGGEVGCDTTL